MRLGLIGCGHISEKHFEAITMIPRIELKAVCDIKEDRMAKYKVDKYQDYKKLLKRKDIDLISICTPSGLHVQMGMDVANAGKDALIEKPLGINLKEVDNLIEYFKEKKRKLYAVLQVRFNPPLIALKNAIGKMGKIYNAAMVVRWQRPQKYFDQDEWRGTKKMDGGTLLNQGIHYVDILQWLLGPVESVFAKKDRIAHKIEIEDIVVAILRFKSGTYATLEFTICTYPRNLEASISVLGEKGTVKIGGQAADKIEVWEVKDLPRPILTEGITPNVYAEGLYQGSCPNHQKVYQSIINKTATDGKEARKSLEIIEAIYKSADTNKEVFL
jgi:UDP-N-acetyl-2-amino-2-deoxyglucuronate dehydrogenase